MKKRYEILHRDGMKQDMELCFDAIEAVRVHQMSGTNCSDCIPRPDGRCPLRSNGIEPNDVKSIKLITPKVAIPPRLRHIDDNLSKIKLSGLQVKNIEAVRSLILGLSLIEEYCGIKEVEIEFESFFICPWIDLNEITNHKMDGLVKGLLKKLSEGRQ